MQDFLLKRFSQTLSANATWKTTFPASGFRLNATTVAVAVRFIAQGRIVGESDSVAAGDKSLGMEFDSVEIINGATPQTVSFSLFDGAAGSDAVTGAVAVTNVNASLTNTAATVTNADGQLLPANATRRYLLVQNKDAVGNLYVKFGAGAATTANGVKIAPGGSYEFAGFAPANEVRAIGDIASNANVVVVEG
jgi:hypothetical protein